MGLLGGNSHRGLVIGAVAAVSALVVGSILTFTSGSKSAIDNTQVGATITGTRLHQVLGHLFDGVSTMHVTYASNGGQRGPTREADIIIGPPVQAKVTLTTTTAPPQTATVIIKDNKAYLHTASLGSTWLLMSSADDGVSGTPGLGQTDFELALLGPNTVGTYKGPATVDGIAIREYALSVSPSATAQASPSPGVAPRLVATVWIDTTGRLIQLTYSPTGQGDWITATYSNWGESVTVQAPPSKDVNVLAGSM